MIILSVHNHYQQAGGEDQSTALEVAMLRARGHEVIEYREHNDRIFDMPRLQTAARTIWSFETYRNIRRVIRERRPDVVHIQNFFPLISPSAHYAVSAESVPLVQSIRNYRLTCANGLFLRENRVCEDCCGRGGPVHGIIHKCYRQDRAATTIVAAMQVAHRATRTWIRLVDRYITLTEFARGKAIAGGLPADRVVVKPNFADDPGRVRSEPGCHGVYIGRLSEEKGIRTLLEAWAGVPGLPLKIVGSGPLESQLRELSTRLGIDQQVEFLGRKTPTEIFSILAGARMLVFPSLWYETFGRVAIEAFAMGVPVIASRLGAMAEVVEHGSSGLHFEPGNPQDLAEKVRWAMANPAEWARFGRNARRLFELRYTEERNYEMLMKIYSEAITSGDEAS